VFGIGSSGTSDVDGTCASSAGTADASRDGGSRSVFFWGGAVFPDVALPEDFFEALRPAFLRDAFALFRVLFGGFGSGESSVD